MIKRSIINGIATKLAVNVLVYLGFIYVPLAIGQTSASPTTSVPQVLAKVNPVTGSAGSASWREDYVEGVAVQAYLYAFPWLYNDLLRWKWITQPQKNPRLPSMPMNEFWHSRELTDASYRDGGQPNNDTLYSVAWVDLKKEPMVLTIPEMSDRYFSVTLMGYDADNYDYISKRTTGTHAGNYALIGPNWTGTLPKGVKPTAKAPTTMVLALVRMLIDSPKEQIRLNKLQDQIRLVPLSKFNKIASVAQEPSQSIIPPPFPRAKDDLADWRSINRAMTEINPPVRDEKLIRQFALLHIGPGQNIDDADEATKRGLAKGLKKARDILTSAAAERAIAGTTRINGWTFTPPDSGHIGIAEGNYLSRAIMSLRGINSSDQAEGMYIAADRDTTGKVLSGNDSYVIHFKAGNLPPVNAFWSLTAYDEQYNLISNESHRYSIGNRTQGLQYDADGGLTLYVQKSKPDASKVANWLPVGDGVFQLVIRTYLPKESILQRSWVPPSVVHMN